MQGLSLRKDYLASAREEGDGQSRESGRNNVTVYQGEATYYNLPGAITASGEPFDAKKFTAAMTAEKAGLGDTVTVEYNNGSKTNSVCVTVNDRGPFARDAQGKPIKPLTPDANIIIDLTPAAFRALVGSLGPGRVPVTVRVP
jgi:hypothetical protein